MKSISKFLAILLTLSLLIPASGIALAEDDEKVTITWLGYYTSSITVSEDTYAEQLLEEYFNVEIIPVTDVNADNISVYIASGDILDVTCFTTYLYSDYEYLYEQELIRNFPEEWLYEYAPTLMEIYAGYFGEEYFEEAFYSEDGYCLYTPYNEGADISESIIIYRKDWMENLGLSEPTTLDELHDLLYAFTYDDPDGNGIDDTYGWGYSMAWYGAWFIYGAFGFTNTTTCTNGTFLLQDDGSVTYTTVTDAYKEALSIIKEWYDEGIIEPNCLTNDRSDVRTLWSNGTIGMMVDSQTWFYSNRGSSSIAALVQSVYGEDSVDVMGALTSDYGDGTVYASFSYPDFKTNRALMFSAEATDEQVIAVLQILEGLSSDHDLLISIIYGEEGIDYEYGDDGEIVVSSDLSIEDMAAKGISDTFYGLGAIDDEMSTITFTEQDKAFIEKAETWDWQTLTRGTNFTDVDNESYDLYISEVQKVASEFYSGVMLGTYDLETDWDDYVSDMYAAGLTAILEEYEELLS